jgi:uncharacterized membrane protein
MNEVAMSVSAQRVSLRKRLLIYLAVWALSGLAFQVFLQPMGLTETHLTPTEQRVRWPIYTPLMALVGLAQSFTWPASPGTSAGFAAFACFAVHAVVALTRTRWSSVAGLFCIQTLLLAVAVIYFVRHSQLPTGG